MDRLKAELLLIARDRGDLGTTDEHRQCIDKYLEALHCYLTPEGIKAFTAVQLRTPYVEFVKAVITNSGWEEASQCVIRFFHTRHHQRDKPPEVAVSSDSVVDIFSHRS